MAVARRGRNASQAAAPATGSESMTACAASALSPKRGTSGS